MDKENLQALRVVLNALKEGRSLTDHLLAEAVAEIEVYIQAFA